MDISSQNLLNEDELFQYSDSDSDSSILSDEENIQFMDHIQYKLNNNMNLNHQMNPNLRNSNTKHNNNNEILNGERKRNIFKGSSNQRNESIYISNSSKLIPLKEHLNKYYGTFHFPQEVHVYLNRIYIIDPRNEVPLIDIINEEINDSNNATKNKFNSNTNSNFNNANGSNDSNNAFKFLSRMDSQKEIVSNCVLYLSSKLEEFHETHVLLNGFQKSNGVSTGVKNIFLPGLQWTNPNSSFEEMQNEFWNMIRLNIGNKIMVQLLCNETIFLQLKNNCMWQLTGEPLNIAQRKTIKKMFYSDQKYKNMSKNMFIIKLNRLVQNDRNDSNNICHDQFDNIDNIDNNHMSSKLSLDLTIHDNNLINKNNSDSNFNEITSLEQISVGKKRKRSQLETDSFSITQRKNTNNPCYQMSKTFISRKSMLFAPPSFLKNGFPDKHELNVLNPSSKTNAKLLYSLIFQTKRAPPTTLSHIIDLLIQFKENQLKYGKKFFFMLEKYCPIKLLEIDLDESLTKTKDNLNDKLNDKYKFLIQQHSTSNQVSTFIHHVLNRIIPIEFFGSDLNKNIIYKHISKFLSLSIYDSYNLDEAMQEVSITECKWAFLKKDSTHQKTNQFLAATSRVAKFVLYIFKNIVISLIKSYFYCTETNENRSQIYYYRRDIWKKINKVSYRLLTLESDLYEKIPPEEVNKQLQENSFSNPGVARLLPKKQKIRPIINLSRKYFNRAGRKVDTNTLLKTILHAMRFEFENAPWKLGSSVFSPKEAYKRILPFVKSWRNASNSKKKLYFVSVDVTGAYDNIPQDSLWEISKDIFQCDTYLIVRYFLLQPSLGSLSMNYECEAMHPSDYPPTFEKFFNRFLSDKLKKSILVDQVVRRFVSKEEILKMLEDHIFKNIVRIGNKHFRQSKGIPQGSVLSPLLCSYLYSHLERCYLSHLPGTIPLLGIHSANINKFGQQSNIDNISNIDFNDKSSDIGILVRLIDDFLYVTTDIEAATSFLKSMQSGFASYGIKINEEKTKINFKDPNIGISNCLSEIQWCGFKIDTHTFQITKSYEKYYGLEIKKHTTSRLYQPSNYFAKKLKSKISFIMSPILLDGTINTIHTIYINIYQCAIFVAIHFHIFRKISRATTTEFLTKVIEDILGYFAIIIRLRTTIIRDLGSNCPVEEKVFVCLILDAFIKIFKKKPTFYERKGGLLEIVESNKKQKLSALSKDQMNTFNQIVNDSKANDLFNIKF